MGFEDLGYYFTEIRKEAQRYTNFCHIERSKTEPKRLNQKEILRASE